MATDCIWQWQRPEILFVRIVNPYQASTCKCNEQMSNYVAAFNTEALPNAILNYQAQITLHIGLNGSSFIFKRMCFANVAAIHKKANLINISCNACPLASPPSPSSLTLPPSFSILLPPSCILHHCPIRQINPFSSYRIDRGISPFSSSVLWHKKYKFNTFCRTKRTMYLVYSLDYII